MCGDDVAEVTRWSAVDPESSACGSGSATANDSDSDERMHEDRIVVTDRESPKLTVAAVARRLGIAPATLRTWDRRYGLGPSEHASGSHRRYGPEDVARLEFMQHALLRGASPAEAARYAHAAAARGETGSRGEADPVEGRAASAAASPEAAREQRLDEAPVLHAGVLEDGADGPVERVSTVNNGGRGLRLGNAVPLARGLGRAVQALDSPAAQQLLMEGIAEQGVSATRRDVLRPLHRALAEYRERGAGGVEMVQLLDDSALTAFRSVIAQARKPRNPRPVLLVTAPGEPQSLELVALAAALSASGVGHRLFGPALPKEGLDAAIQRAAPVAALVWAEQSAYADTHMLTNLPNPRQRVRVLAGGPGWSPASMPEHVELLDCWDTALHRVVETALGTTP